MDSQISTPITIVIKRELCRWNSKQEWIDNSISDLVNSKVRESNYIAVNSNGLVCRTSYQFTKTEKDNAFPVIAYELN